MRPLKKASEPSFCATLKWRWHHFFTPQISSGFVKPSIELSAIYGKVFPCNGWSYSPSRHSQSNYYSLDGISIGCKSWTSTINTFWDTTNTYVQPTPPIPKYLFQCSDHLVAITSKGLITTATTNPDRKAANKLFCQAGLPGPNISVTLV